MTKLLKKNVKEIFGVKCVNGVTLIPYPLRLKRSIVAYLKVRFLNRMRCLFRVQWKSVSE